MITKKPVAIIVHPPLTSCSTPEGGFTCTPCTCEHMLLMLANFIVCCGDDGTSCASSWGVPVPGNYFGTPKQLRVRRRRRTFVKVSVLSAGISAEVTKM